MTLSRRVLLGLFAGLPLAFRSGAVESLPRPQIDAGKILYLWTAEDEWLVYRGVPVIQTTPSSTHWLDPRNLAARKIPRWRYS